VTTNKSTAKSKRSKIQCGAPALKGKRVCKTHGGRSTGPKTEVGRQRCSDAKTDHGRETREARIERSLGSARLACSMATVLVAAGRIEWMSHTKSCKII